MSAPTAFIARPPSEVEWEDLLVRYEIGPRAFRVALEDADDLAGDARTRVCDLLRALVMNEMLVAGAFELMRTGARPTDEVRAVTLADEPRAIHQRYEQLRGRNFAAVQRRGLEVWDWHADIHPHGEVSAYQLIQASAALDGETLAAVRAAMKGVGV